MHLPKNRDCQTMDTLVLESISFLCKKTKVEEIKKPEGEVSAEVPDLTKKVSEAPKITELIMNEAT